MKTPLSKSRFNMWRAVVAMMHADFVVRPHEINFVLENTRDLPMTDEQREVISTEIKTPAAIDDVFHMISNDDDREDFFHLARAIAWSDGDFDENEQELLRRLGDVHFEGNEESDMRHSRTSFAKNYLEESNDVSGTRDIAVVRMIRHLLSL